MSFFPFIVVVHAFDRFREHFLHNGSVYIQEMTMGENLISPNVVTRCRSRELVWIPKLAAELINWINLNTLHICNTSNKFHR